MLFLESVLTNKMVKLTLEFFAVYLNKSLDGTSFSLGQLSWPGSGKCVHVHVENVYIGHAVRNIFLITLQKINPLNNHFIG